MDNLFVTGDLNTRQVYVGDILLDPEESLKLRNHSPDGFMWGYGGSGPAQLSLALLLYLTKNNDFSLRNYQDFKFDVISKLPMHEDFSIPINNITEWINNKLF